MRYDTDGEEIFYLKSIREAKGKENTEYCIAEMPDDSFVVYKNKLYKIIDARYTDKIICIQYVNLNIKYINGSENGIYVGGNPFYYSNQLKKRKYNKID